MCFNHFYIILYQSIFIKLIVYEYLKKKSNINIILTKLIYKNILLSVSSLLYINTLYSFNIYNIYVFTLT